MTLMREAHLVGEGASSFSRFSYMRSGLQQMPHPRKFQSLRFHRLCFEYIMQESISTTNLRRVVTMKEISKRKIKFKPVSFASSDHALTSLKDIVNKKQTQTKQFDRLKEKLASKENMKAVSRGFNKSFYGKLASRINGKPASFYKFGLKEEEKKTCKMIFREIFDVEQSVMNGTISVGELWSNKNTLKYLKENKMFFNKEALIHQFEDMNKNLLEKKKELKKSREKEVIKRYRRALVERKTDRSSNNRVQLPSEDSAYEDPVKACKSIRVALDSISSHKMKMRTQSRSMISTLERDFDKMGVLGDNFNRKMILL